jgi:hypothetical protein
MKYKLKFLESAKDDKEEIKKYLSKYYPSTPKNFVKSLRIRIFVKTLDIVVIYILYYVY